jgi:hypothetical protein
MSVLKKLTIVGAIMVLLTFSGTPLVLAQQGESVGSDTGSPEEGVARGDPSFDAIDLNGPGNTDAGFVQYGSEPPPGAYYDCPPLTEPQMLRPCILVTP